MVTSPRPRLTPGLLGVLGFMAAVGPLSTDLYLSSFTSITTDLDASPAQVQLTLSVFMLGLGFGQLVLGPLSDRAGRRPVLIAALAVFTLAGVAVTVTPSIEFFIALRLVQGFAGAGGVVLARAIAADLSSGGTAVRALSLIAMVVGLGPLLAPVIGGAVHEVLGWRGVLGTMAVASAAMLVLVWALIPESLPAGSRTHGGLGSAFRPFGSLLRDWRYLPLMLSFSLGFAMMLAYISASPFVGQRVLHLDQFVYALGFSAGASAMIVSNLVNARVAPRVGADVMLRLAVGLGVLGSGAMLTLVATGILAPWSFILCAFVVTSGAVLTMSNASALALDAADRARGAGSALLGGSQFLVASAVIPLVGLWGEHTALPMAIVMSVCAVLALGFAVFALRRS